MLIYYASADGVGDGSSSQTPGSLSSAIAYARTNAGVDSITVYLLEGLYSLTNTWILEAQDSGTAEKPILWSSYNGGNTTLSGGVELSNWVLHDVGKNIWKTSVPSFSRQLFVNGERRWRVRYGSVPELNHNLWVNYFTFDPFPALARPADVEFLFRMTMAASAMELRWTEARVGVASIVVSEGETSFYLNPNALQDLMLDEGSETTAPLDFSRGPTAIENAYEFLTSDTKGQFYINPSTLMIYYVPMDTEMSGGNFTGTAVLPVLEHLIQANQSSQVEYVDFYGIHFEHSTWLKPTTEQMFLQIQANAFITADDSYNPSVKSLPKAAVDVLGASYVNFTGCSFRHLGGMGLRVGEGSNNIIVEGNEFDDISGNGFLIGSIVDRNPIVADQVSDISFTNSTITNVAIEYIGGVGGMVAYCKNTSVTFNTVTNCPYTGISIGWGWLTTPGYTTNIDVSWNRISETMSIVEDGGSIYMLGNLGGSIVSYNFCDNAGQNTNHVLYADEGTCDVDIFGNVVTKNSLGGPARWLGFNVATQPTVEARAFDNYYQTGMGTQHTNAEFSQVYDNTTLQDETVANWPVQAQNVYYNSGAFGTERVSFAVRSDDSIVVYSWGGSTIYADFDDNTPTTQRTSGVAFEISENAGILYYYASDGFYSEDVKSLALTNISTLDGSPIILTTLSGDPLTTTPLGG